MKRKIQPPVVEFFAAIFLIWSAPQSLAGVHQNGESIPAGGPSNGEIHVVRNWRDLMSQPRVEVGGDVSVRLGISATNAPLNSGALVYCLTDGYDYFKNPNLKLQSLGPLSVKVRRGSESLIVNSTNFLGLSYHGDPTTGGCTLFFARQLLIDAPGLYEISVCTRPGRQIAKAAIATDRAFYHPWTPFLLEQESEWEWISRTDYTFRQTKPAVLSVPGIGIAVNAWSGNSFKVISGHAVLDWESLDLDSTPRKPEPQLNLDSSLPLLVPDRSDPDLKMSVQEGFVTLTSTTNFCTAGPDMWFLARWWVNGKPFVPRKGHAPEHNGGIVLHFDRQMRFKLNLDPTKLGARTGDRVTMQLLLCNGWCYVENPEVTEWPNSAGGENARLTEKVEFIVTRLDASEILVNRTRLVDQISWQP